MKIGSTSPKVAWAVSMVINQGQTVYKAAKTAGVEESTVHRALARLRAVRVSRGAFSTDINIDVMRQIVSMLNAHRGTSEWTPAVNDVVNSLGKMLAEDAPQSPREA